MPDYYCVLMSLWSGGEGSHDLQLLVWISPPCGVNAVTSNSQLFFLLSSPQLIRNLVLKCTDSKKKSGSKYVQAAFIPLPQCFCSTKCGTAARAEAGRKEKDIVEEKKEKPIVDSEVERMGEAVREGRGK